MAVFAMMAGFNGMESGSAEKKLMFFFAFYFVEIFTWKTYIWPKIAF